MVDQRVMSVNKPSRSDEVIDPKQQLKVAHEVRAHFESFMPKRPTKPNCSEPDHPDDSLIHIQAYSEHIPELNNLHQLKSQAIWSMEGGGGKQEEFVETEYYKQLEMIEKQHHTTGTGFIKIGRGNEEGLNIEEQRTRLSENVRRLGGYKPKSNPATNDWIPSSEGDYQVHVSTKPSRSG